MRPRLLPRDQQNHQRDRQSRKASRSKKYVRLLLPNGESSGRVHGDRYYNRKMGKAVSRQQAILVSHLADEASCTAIAAAYGAD